jgi:uncharacterized protein (TIGR00297 family)
LTKVRVELARKTVHVGMGAFSLLLRWLDWKQAAAVAALALVFNLFVLPRAGGGHLMREDDLTRGFPIGVLLYPIVVLLLILAFREDLALAAAGWAFLAFGDGFATLAGIGLGRARLPWNARKSWAGSAAYVLAGGLGAILLFGFVARRAPSTVEIAVLLFGALVGAAVESLPSELDDNLVAPVVAAAAVSLALRALAAPLTLTTAEFVKRAELALVINLAVAVAGGFSKIVRPSGAVAGFLLGSLVYAFGGPGAYGLLWVFFAVGTVATRFGRKRKEAMGKAEESGGRRGAKNVLANVAVPAFFAVLSGLTSDAALSSAFALAAAAAFATALMDTVGTEVGQVIRTRTVLLPDFTPVPPGTDGAVSIAGTFAGLLAAGFLAAVALDLKIAASPRGAVVILVAAALGTVAESVLGRSGAPWRVTDGHVLNFYNTIIGAAVGFLLAT